MIFKNKACEEQLSASHPNLQEIAWAFDRLSMGYGIESVVTRVWDAVCGDSGVHEAKRAIDFRDETRPSETESIRLYTAEQVESIVSTMNAKYPRSDGKVVCIHHSFHGMSYHFHLQIPIGWIG